MTCSAAIPESAGNELRQIAVRLADADVTDLIPVNGGGNSRVCRVDTRDGRRFALKSYPPRVDDPRDRLATEFNSLMFLRGQGETAVPRPVMADRRNGCALYEWIDGEIIHSPAEADIDAAVAFARRLYCFRSAKAAGKLSAASDACFSGEELMRQINDRACKLSVAGMKAPLLEAFLSDEFLPLKDTVFCWTRDVYHAAGLDCGQELPVVQRTLSPSDFGFHNALRRRGGKIVFLDFEYFGWDDPAKLVLDFLWHPGMALNDLLMKRFLLEAQAIHDSDKTFPVRLRALYPLLGLKWCMIILNEFLSSGRARRIHANGPPVEKWAEVEQRQLNKAHHVIQKIQETYEGFEYAG